MATTSTSANPAVAALAKGVSPAVLEAINAKIEPDEIANAIREMLDATLASGLPDWRAREIAIKTYLSYTVGLPVQRQEIIQHRIVSKPDAGKLLSTPSALEALARSLANNPEGRDKLLAALQAAA